MADAESSSDDDWFEPEDLTISTVNLFSNTQNGTAPDAPAEHAPNTNSQEAAPTNQSQTQPQASTLPNIDDLARPTIDLNVQAPADDAPVRFSTPPDTPPIHNGHNHNYTSPASASPLHNSRPPPPAHSASAETEWKEKTALFPAALRDAYKQMSSGAILHSAGDDDDTHPNTDIDNLPLHTAKTPMLSLTTLRDSARKTDALTEQKSPAKDTPTNSGRYNKFFIKNFFLKKPDSTKAEHHKAETDEQKSELINRIKMRGNTKAKEMKDLRLCQKVSEAHKGAIYCMEFSKKGDYLASGGQDSVLRVWTVVGSRADQKRWDRAQQRKDSAASAPSEPTADETTANGDSQPETTETADTAAEHVFELTDVISTPAYREFTGHRADIIDISWSNGEFILSASIDQTVMLWHTSRTRCLCLFQHSDIVTSVQFHPSEDYLFLSGSFDSRLRLWNILEHRVVDWVQVPTLVTCTAFSVNGKFAIAGLYDGQCFFYSTQGHRLKYVTAIECRNNSGKYRKGRKVTGLQYLPVAPSTKNGHSKAEKQNEHGSPHLLISTNDSRLRLFSLGNFAMQCKYKGHENTQSQIHARFSPDGQYIICGSEDNAIYIWRVSKSEADEGGGLFHTVASKKKAKSRQEHYEYFRSEGKLPQVAMFAPHRTLHYVHKFRTVVHKERMGELQKDAEKVKHIVVTADTEGHICIYTNHSNDEDYRYPFSYHSRHSATREKMKKKDKHK